MQGLRPNEYGFRFPDGAVWRFRQEFLEDGGTIYMQIEATDISDLYFRREELRENNRRMRELTKRQRGLLATIVQTNREKELLSVKMRVHDELGQCILTTKRLLEGPLTPENVFAISQAWENAIRDFSNIPLDEGRPLSSPKEEILKVASLIGCRVDLRGDEPSGLGTKRLLYSAVREALINAVRHANADCLYVRCRQTDRLLHAEISDNSGMEVPSLREGIGLSGLRQRIERAGGTLDIRCGRGVLLLVDLPLTAEDRAAAGADGSAEQTGGRL